MSAETATTSTGSKGLAVEYAAPDQRSTRFHLHGLCPAVDAGKAGTCQPVKAKGVDENIATAKKYAQDDLEQTAKALKGKVTQASTNCGPVAHVQNLGSRLPEID